jgi:hypothetical protein
MSQPHAGRKRQRNEPAVRGPRRSEIGSDPERAVRIAVQRGDDAARHAVLLAVARRGLCSARLAYVKQAVGGADPQALVPCRRDGIDLIVCEAGWNAERARAAIRKARDPAARGNPHVAFVVLEQRADAVARQPILLREALDRGRPVVPWRDETKHAVPTRRHPQVPAPVVQQANACHRGAVPERVGARPRRVEPAECLVRVGHPHHSVRVLAESADARR